MAEQRGSLTYMDGRNAPLDMTDEPHNLVFGVCHERHNQFDNKACNELVAKCTKPNCNYRTHLESFRHGAVAFLRLELNHNGIT